MSESQSTQPPSSRLEQLGYSQQLERRLNIPEVVGLAMADVDSVDNAMMAAAIIYALPPLAVLFALRPLCGGELGHERGRAVKQNAVRRPA